MGEKNLPQHVHYRNLVPVVLLALILLVMCSRWPLSFCFCIFVVCLPDHRVWNRIQWRQPAAIPWDRQSTQKIDRPNCWASIHCWTLHVVFRRMCCIWFDRTTIYFVASLIRPIPSAIKSPDWLAFCNKMDKFGTKREYKISTQAFHRLCRIVFRLFFFHFTTIYRRFAKKIICTHEKKKWNLDKVQPLRFVPTDLKHQENYEHARSRTNFHSSHWINPIHMKISCAICNHINALKYPSVIIHITREMMLYHFFFLLSPLPPRSCSLTV